MTPREIMEAVQQFCAENYPGCKLQFITIHCRRLPKPIRLAAVPARSEQASNKHAPEELPLCVQEILQTLREVKRPLSLTLLKEEMDKRGRSYSRSSLAHYCAELVQDGTLENPEDARPRGYRVVSEDDL